MPQNADYVFADDAVILELKCLKTDPTVPGAYIERLGRAFQKLGYSEAKLIRTLVL